MSARTMMFGDDGSPSADVAWLWINSHSWSEWTVNVVTADMPVTVRASATRPQFEPWDPPHPRVAQFGLGADVAHVRIDEDPRLALSSPSDLLVIGGGNGKGRLRRLGSTAEWLMTRPPSPMVVVRHGRPTRKVVVCYDGSAHAHAATQALGSMPWVDQLQVTVVAVDDGRIDSQAAVDEAVGILSAANIAADHRVLAGNPTDELCRFP